VTVHLIYSKDPGEKKTSLKPQSNGPAHSGGPGQSQSQDIGSFQSGSAVQSDANFTFALRTTSSGIVTSKPSSKAVGPQMKKKTVPDAEPDNLGGLSAEDDSREKEMALSSPMKGGELRATKVRLLLSISSNGFILFQSLVKVKAEQVDTKSRKRATAQDLPKGANEDTAWTRLVIPNFVNAILAGEQPWVVTDDAVIAELQSVWDHVYGMKVEFTIEKGTVPFELVSHIDLVPFTQPSHISHLGAPKAL